MKVSKRRTGVISSPICECSRRRVNDPAIDLQSEGHSPTKCIGLVSWDLLVTSFSQIRPNIWFLVVPESDEMSDISTGTRQKWDDIMSLLIHCGLKKKIAWQAMVSTLFHQNGTNFVGHSHPCQRYILEITERRVRPESFIFV